MNKAERKKTVLETAAHLMIHPENLDLLAGMTFERLSVETGIDSSQISRDFSSDTVGGKEGLCQELATFALHPTAGLSGDPLGTFFSEIEATATNPNLTLEEKVEAWAHGLTRAASAKNQLHREMLLWGVSKNNRTLTMAFERLFKNWIDQGRIIVDDLQTDSMQNHDTKHKKVLTSRDLAVAVTGLTIGLGIIGGTSENLIPHELHKKALLAFLQTPLNEETEPEIDLNEQHSDTSP